MTAQTYFDDISRKRRRITPLQLRLEELRYQAAGVTSVRYDLDRVQTSSKNRMEAILTGAARKTEEQYIAAITDYHAQWQEAEQRVLGMDNPVFSDLLQLRYLQDTYRPMRFEQISVLMGYSYDRIRHMHRDALQAFEQQYLQGGDDHASKKLAG